MAPRDPNTASHFFQFCIPMMRGFSEQNAEKRYIIKCCDLLSWIFGLMHGSGSHQKSAGKQTPSIVVPSLLILMKKKSFIVRII